MPKKSKKLYQNFSTVYVPRFEEIWDDTELISQYDQSLKEWKEALVLGTNESDVANWRDPDPEPEEEAPTIGPWVAVEAKIYNPETAAQSNYAPAFHDFELANYYDDALEGWREERETEEWKKVVDMLQEFHLFGDSTSIEESKASPWVLVNRDESGEKSDCAAAEELVDDLDASSGFSGALQDWKDERMQTEHGAGSKDNKLSEDVQSENTTLNAETRQSSQLQSEASTTPDSCPTSSNATEPDSKPMDT